MSNQPSLPPAPNSPTPSRESHVPRIVPPKPVEPPGK